MPSSLQARLRELLLMVASAITIIGTTAIAASLPKMSHVFADTPHGHYLVKVSLTVPALTAGLFAVPSGQIVDRWGRRPLFIASLVLYGAAGCAGFLLHSLYAILLSRLLLGAAVAGVSTCATALIADYTPRDRIGRAMGRQSLFMALGNVVFVFSGGLLADQGWRWPFLLYGIGFVLVPAAVVLIREPRSTNDPAPVSAAPAAARAAQGEVPPAATGTIALTYVLLFVNMVGYFMVPVYLPFYLASFHHGDSLRAGALLSVVGVAWALSSLVYRRLAQRMPYERVTVLTFGLLGAAYVLLGTASSYPVLVAALVLTGAGLGSAIPNLNSWMLAVTPPAAKGRVIGARVCTTFLGQFVSPVITAPLTAAAGIGHSYVIAGAVMAAVAGGVAVALLLRLRRAAPAPEAVG
ncbi:MFS transporter [Streptomyces sp. CA2R106]|uniref:MFS transporter n=1 Tax=Streptomyces sp. CA2R106 TaxID=3120153 RepID=UPI00300927E1